MSDVMKGKSDSNMWVAVIALIVVAYLVTGGGKTFSVAPVTPSGGTTGVGPSECQYQETATWTVKDKFGTTLPGGTGYYKIDGLAATTTAPTISAGTQYTYWVSNSTWYVAPRTITAQCGNTPVIADAWQNASVTLAGYDQYTTIASASHNVTLAANGIVNLQFTYQGTAKKSAAPFGGVMVVEAGTNISSVTCTGSGISQGLGGYHITYSVASTVNAPTFYTFDSSLDDGSGALKTVSCQFKAGSSAPASGSAFYVKFIPANYYYTNAGEIVLDTEKYANQDTTRTGISNPNQTFTGYWA